MHTTSNKNWLTRFGDAFAKPFQEMDRQRDQRTATQQIANDFRVEIIEHVSPVMLEPYRKPASQITLTECL